MVSTQPMSDELQLARHGLIRMLAGPHEELGAELAVIEALAIVEDVPPPYPPPADQGDPQRAGGGSLRKTLAHLDRAVATATAAEEAMRAAHAARMLRGRGPNPAP